MSNSNEICNKRNIVENGDTTPKGILTYEILVCECEMKTQKILEKRNQIKIYRRKEEIRKINIIEIQLER